MSMSDRKKEWKPGPWRASTLSAGESDTEALFVLFERAESERVRAALDKVRGEETAP